MPAARAKGRGKLPRILMNGQAAAYSSRCRIGGSVTVPPPKFICKPRSCHSEPLAGARAESVGGIRCLPTAAKKQVPHFARNDNLLIALVWLASLLRGRLRPLRQ